MGLMVRLGLIFLGIGTLMFLWENIFLGMRFLIQLFPQLGELVIGMLGALLGSLLAQPLKEGFHRIAEGYSRLLIVFLCLLGLILICCGLALGFWESMQQNRKWKDSLANKTMTEVFAFQGFDCGWYLT